MTNIFNKFGDNKSRSFGAGMQVRQMPQSTVTRMDNFSLGLNMTDDPEGVPSQSMPVATDLEIDHNGRIIRAPGTTWVGTFDTTKRPTRVFHSMTADGVERLFFIDQLGQKVGYKNAWSATIWQSLPQPEAYTGLPFSGVSYGDFFIFSNSVYTWTIDASGTLALSFDIPAFTDAAIIEGRLYTINLPNQLQWSGVSFTDFSSIIAGAEPLLGDGSIVNQPVAIRSVSHDLSAILCKDSVWVGRPTGDPTRPVDFTLALNGAGCVVQSTAIATPIGLIYLAADGVHVFNGNDSPIISQAINKELLSLRPAYWRASYNQLNERYYLYTDSATYIFETSNPRWYKRSLICYGGTEYSSIDGDGQLRFLFLGINAGETNLEREDYNSTQYFGVDFSPTYEGPTSINPDSANLKMVSEIRITYSGFGTLDLYLQNQERNYELVSGGVSLPLTSELRNEKLTFTHVGELLGLKFVITSGKLEIAALEMDWIPRGPNLSNQVKVYHFEQDVDGSFFITDMPGPAYGWFLDTVPTPNEIVFDSTLVGPTFSIVGYDTDGSPFIEV